MEENLMERITKKSFVETLCNGRCALIGAPWNWNMEKITNSINDIPADGIRYRDRKILGARTVKKATSSRVTFQTDDGESLLDLTNGEFYEHTAQSGKFLIAFWKGQEENRSNSCIYALEK